MGLDMYLKGERFYWTNWEHPELNKMAEGFKLQRDELELGYWRKHPNLHGFIIQEFASGEDNCEPIGLDEEDIEKIIRAIENDLLPTTKGFFFGTSEDSETQRKQDIEIFRNAIKWQKEKLEGVSKSITYEASW